ncbi:MAG: hypothetical protein EON93_17250 [Burkholderiales bacterium]|nr:MAG: hypothetical protein EON93_17250 [Burkholderiales bacterium]
MPSSAQRPSNRTQIADLRASVRSARAKPKFDKAPPIPRKPKKGPAELAAERAEKAERQSMQQHTTSLLTGKSDNGYVRKGQRAQPQGTILGLMFQIVFVVGAVGIGAWVLDPTLVPPEWNDKAHEVIYQIKTHEMVRDWVPA